MTESTHPPITCKDNSVVPSACARNSFGVCDWRPAKCPDLCRDLADQSSCSVDPRCRWMAPGCTQPGLPAAGCYPKQDLNCTTSNDCKNEKSCLTRMINPCDDKATCLACAAPVNVCL